MLYIPPRLGKGAGALVTRNTCPTSIGGQSRLRCPGCPHFQHPCPSVSATLHGSGAVLIASPRTESKVGKKWVSGTQCRGPPYRCRRGDPAPRHWHLGLPSLGSSTLAARWCSANVTAASRLVGQWHRTHLAVSTSLQWSRRQPSRRCVV